jgi:sensor domain CHASE-containing protein
MSLRELENAWHHRNFSIEDRKNQRSTSESESTPVPTTPVLVSSSAGIINSRKGKKNLFQLYFLYFRKSFCQIAPRIIVY